MTACDRYQAPAPVKRQTPQSVTESRPEASLEMLTGTIILKGWTKSFESWNAGGSEYYVLKVEDSAVPDGKRTAKEGVILRPSKAIHFEHFANYVGRTVRCHGEFVTGDPYSPPEGSTEQSPSSTENLLRGSGFRVYVIETTEEN